MRRFDNFSPHDFELFVADLLGAELEMRFETFPRGPDGGVDLRFIPRNRTRPHVVQCKHYAGSTFSSLLAAAKKEATRLADLEPVPRSYRFVTSQALTAKRKGRLADALSPWIKSPRDILGAHDLEGLLDKHPEVERRQVKLWLTGGTQLAALLRAGSINRSQTLVDEIERTMPRYVQGRAFADARERLREQNVLIIAGVPGIGKTTLARILLADAVLDGYEPVEVSNDIEEGWELVDDSAKQIFLYDDFLGRTALSERFSKNEDRRLIDFMRRAARRPTILFVLTTREYILRQATQLYERLDYEKVDAERFLLRLSDYTAVDRARIFANHAFHSTRLNHEIKRELLRDASYMRIINHRNYNPRTVEWITGMAGPWGQDVTAANYVDFATGVLSHPELIWRHAFEQELDEHGRTLVLILATLPRRVALTALTTAFEAACETRDLKLTKRAMDRTLAALDDSLVRTTHDDARHENQGILVDPHDPSIIDFVVDYVRQSPGDAVQLAESAVFFEQAEWLWSTLTAGGRSVSPKLLGALAEALMRTFTSSGLTLVSLPVGPNAWTNHPRGTCDLEDRLLAMLPLAREHPAVAGWWKSAVVKRTAAWRKSDGQPESTLALLKALEEDDGIDVAEAGDAAKHVFSGFSRYVQATDWLIQLREAVPDAFALDEWADIVDEFAAWISGSMLMYAEDMADTGELEAIDRVAAALGLSIDDDIWDEASELVRQNVAERDAGFDPDPDDYRDADAGGHAAEAREIEAIFTRLADD